MATGDIKEKDTIKQIGDYMVGKTLGAGSFSKVKLGTSAKSNKKVCSDSQSQLAGCSKTH
jgi:hypothetical protein